MAKDIANTNRTINITPNGTWTPGTPNYVETPSPKSKVDGDGILLTQISWTMVGCINPPDYVLTAGGGIITTTAQKVKCNAQLVMRKDDQGNCIGSLLSPTLGPLPCNCTFQITNAGQNKAKGN